MIEQYENFTQKKSMEYFMFHMTQEEFETEYIKHHEIKPYKFNMIRKLLGSKK